MVQPRFISAIQNRLSVNTCGRNRVSEYGTTAASTKKSKLKIWDVFVVRHSENTVGQGGGVTISTEVDEYKFVGRSKPRTQGSRMRRRTGNSGFAGRGRARCGGLWRGEGEEVKQSLVWHGRAEYGSAGLGTALCG